MSGVSKDPERNRKAVWSAKKATSWISESVGLLWQLAKVKLNQIIRKEFKLARKYYMTM